MKTVNIGIIGFGTVGAGILDNIISNASMMCYKTGVMLAVKAIADLDITTDRGVCTDNVYLTTDVFEVINDSEIDIVVEAIGGYTFAKDVVVAAMNAKKSVVTANKALLSKYFEELSLLAAQQKVDFYYEASVGGGIPCIKTLREGLIANNIYDIYGIVNGTCNYILTRMERENVPFSQILPEAQAAGYAEANPSLDVDGFDTAHKTVILAGLATGTAYTLDDIYIEGIREISLDDVEIAKELGMRIKLLSITKVKDDMVSLCVQPTLISTVNTLGTVNDVFNAIWFHGCTVDDIMMYGRGAGRAATASAVVADLIDIGKNIVNGTTGSLRAFIPAPVAVKPLPKLENSANFYLRINDSDVLALKEALGGIIREEKVGSSTVLFTDVISFRRVAELKERFKQLVAIRFENL